MKKLLMVLSMMASLTVQASDKGNGGGGICYPSGKCITLTEAGFRLPTEVATTQGAYELSYSVLEELDKINNSLPKQYRKFSAGKVIGEPGDLILLESVDNRRTEEFLKEYRQVLVANASSDLARKVEILAFTVKNKTYLIKGKFEALDDRSKALLLIHERSLRDWGYTLSAALKLDGTLLDYLKAKKTNSRPDLRNFISAFGESSLQPSYLLNEYLKTSGPVLVSDGVKPQVSTNSIQFSFENLLRMKKANPELRTQLVNDQLYITTNHYEEDARFGRMALVYKALADIADKFESSGNRKFYLTNELFDETIASYSIPEAAAQNLCGAFADNSYVLTKDHSSDAFTPAYPSLVYCSGVDTNYVLGSRGQFIAFRYHLNILKNLTGLSLNLAHPVKCKITETNYFRNEVPLKDINCEF